MSSDFELEGHYFKLMHEIRAIYLANKIKT